MRPFDPRLFRTVPEARGPFVLLAAVGAAGGAATIATAFALTGVVVAIARSEPVLTPALWLTGLFAARALLAALAEYAAAWAGVSVATALRQRLLAAWASRPAEERPAPATALTLATAGSTAIEPYAARYLPALLTAAVVPVGAIGILALVDWPSALVVVLTLPLLPLFAALIGKTTQQQTERRWRALADLAGHFLDVVRGLPTLVSYGRAEKQIAAIGEVSDRHRAATMKTLRLAFLSSAALELLATISVAIVAVLSGVRLAHGSMDLSSAMVAILLAPEAYWPVRRVGQEFHNAADGASALAEITVALAPDADDDSSAGDTPKTDMPKTTPTLRRVASPRPRTGPDEGTGAAAYEVELSGVGYSHPGANERVINDLTLRAGPGLTVVTGASGVGKTTLLDLIAGLRRPDAGGLRAPRAHLVTQRPFIPTGTVAAALALGTGAPTAAQWGALRAVGLDGTVAGLPQGLQTTLGDDGFGLSAGQRARLGLARALLAPESVILLDEPTAHLDDASAAIAHTAIAELATRACVLAVTHRRELVDIADAHVHLTRPAGTPAEWAEVVDQSLGNHPVEGASS